jgi:hypothetical protein
MFEPQNQSNANLNQTKQNHDESHEAQPGSDGFPHIIVSVESRKGGVGKTTAALSLGRILQHQGYAVLMLDLDVTGTNAADIANSPFWSSDLHIIKQVSKEGDKRSEDAQSANLLSIFDECFMTGKKPPTFSNVSTDEVELSLNVGRVNVLGSQIYRTDSPKNVESKQGPICLERPSVLFDDLHTLWLLDFIRQLISDFCRAVHCTKPERDKVAVILDNSPGYVGIAPAIHEWLTDCGPDIGKFINVASLDVQDLLACARGVSVLHGLFQTKWKTSRLFCEAGNNGGNISVGKDQEAFFMRLATSGGPSVVNDSLVFYKGNDKGAAQESGDEYVTKPFKYIGLLINRVPRAVKRGRLVYDFQNDVVVGLGSVIGGPSSGYQGDAWRECMVSFDEYIENQFLLQSLKRGSRRSGHRLQFLVDRLSDAIGRLSSDIRKSFSVSILLRSNGDNLQQLQAQLSSCNELVTRARSALDAYGLDHLARLIRDEWMPNNIVSSFRNALSGLLSESEFMHFEVLPFELDSELIKPVEIRVVKRLREHINEALHESSMDLNGLVKDTAETLTGLLLSLVGLSFGSTSWRPEIQDELAEFLAGILVIELRHWKESRGNKPSRHGLQRFLAQEAVSNVEIEKDFMMSGGSRFFRHMMRSEGVTTFSEFYKVCTCAQARLIDFAADSQFLLRLMQYMLREGDDKQNLFPFVRGLAEEVIERKTVSHEAAPDKMARALQSAEYFREFDQVLGRILNGWGVVNG